MALSDFQVTYNGVTFGPGGEYRVKQVDGFRTMPELRVSDYAKLKHHGAYSGIDVLEGRHITMTVHVVGTSAADLDTQLMNLETATVPLLTGTLPMSFKLPNQITKRVNARARKRAATQTPTYGRFHQEVMLDFFCPDPRIYDDVSTTTASITTSGSVTNAGNFESRPIITVTPSSSPVTITNTSDGSNIIRLATSTIGSIPNPTTIDLQARTVVDSTGANRFDVVDSATTWTVLNPGANALTISGGSMTVTYRSAWI